MFRGKKNVSIKPGFCSIKLRFFDTRVKKGVIPIPGITPCAVKPGGLLLKRNREHLSGVDQIRIIQDIAVGVENLHVFSGLFVKML